MDLLACIRSVRASSAQGGLSTLTPARAIRDPGAERKCTWSCDFVASVSSHCMTVQISESVQERLAQVLPQYCNW